MSSRTPAEIVFDQPHLVSNIESHLTYAYGTHPVAWAFENAKYYNNFAGHVLPQCVTDWDLDDTPILRRTGCYGQREIHTPPLFPMNPECVDDIVTFSAPPRDLPPPTAHRNFGEDDYDISTDYELHRFLFGDGTE